MVSAGMESICWLCMNWIQTWLQCFKIHDALLAEPSNALPVSRPHSPRGRDPQTVITVGLALEVGAPEIIRKGPQPLRHLAKAAANITKGQRREAASKLKPRGGTFERRGQWHVHMHLPTSRTWYLHSHAYVYAYAEIDIK